MTHQVVKYEEAVELLYRIPRFNPNHSLEQIKCFLNRMGQPDRQMKIVHVAGTNGKGSTSAYLAGLLEQCGLKVGLFTSPHLVDVRERFRINGQMISKELFTEAVQHIQGLLSEAEAENGALSIGGADSQKTSEDGKQSVQYTPCYFDMMFFIGMYAFSKEQVDIVVLETGLGGRLDATNAVSHKELTVITHIGLDHTEYLGDTLEAIAAEKAGIMIPEIPCVVGAHNELCYHIFTKKAIELGAPCRILDKGDYSCHGVSEKAVDFSYFSSYYGIIEGVLHTTALYQAENAALAIAGIEALIEQGVLKAESLSADQIRTTLASTFWEGRMEEVMSGVFVDGAHNPDGIEAFLNSVCVDGCEGKRILLFSAVSDKNLREMTRQIDSSELFDQIIITQLPEARGANAQMLGDYFEKIPCITEEHIDKALQVALGIQGSEDFIYIAGSLYLVGHIKECI